jgi:hypothetical protein
MLKFDALIIALMVWVLIQLKKCVKNKAFLAYQFKLHIVGSIRPIAAIAVTKF